MDYNNTIVAYATPPGRGGIGILRISGLRARDVAKIVLGKIPKPRYANYMLFKDNSGTPIDQGIAIWFPGPNSFTGEDVLELQAHGGPIVLDMLLKCILKIPDICIANPGEFSKRAFLNKKLDLIQAEAIADLINSSSEQAARGAINSLQGVFSFKINNLIDTLIHLRMHIESGIDFPTENINLFSNKEIEKKINELIVRLDTICFEAQQGSVLHEGIKIVITGRPNVGKSSLLNALAGQEIAIVTDIAGTTRDILHENIHIDGIPLHISDTAGLCDTSNKIECIGIERAYKEIKKADHLLLVVDGSITKLMDPMKILPEFFPIFPKNIPITIVRNKSDITGEIPGISNFNCYSFICLSAKTGKGIEILKNHLKQSINFHTMAANNFLARRRHLQALENAAFYLKRSKKQLMNNFNSELIAEELRLAQQNLSEITGKFTSNDLLDKIFSSFCVGK